MSESGALRAVVDTNLFVSGMISPGGRPRQLLDDLRIGRFDLLLSNWQHAELTGVFERPWIAQRYPLMPEDVVGLFAILEGAIRVIPSAEVPVSLRDPNDEQILAAAIGGNADYLVTGDNDLLVHEGDPRLGSLKIVTAAQFLSVLDDVVGGTGEIS